MQPHCRVNQLFRRNFAILNFLKNAPTSSYTHLSKNLESYALIKDKDLMKNKASGAEFLEIFPQGKDTKFANFAAEFAK